MTLPLPLQSLPAFVLMTDPERRPDPLADVAHLAPGSGLIFRHYNTPDRARLALSLAKAAKKRRITLSVAGDWRLAAHIRADGVHLPEGLLRSGLLGPLLGWAKRRKIWITSACHDRRALSHANRLKLAGALISPIFATQSHPTARTLGLLGLARMARGSRTPVIALGGMTPKRALAVKRRGVNHWASVTPFRLMTLSA